MTPTRRLGRVAKAAVGLGLGLATASTPARIGPSAVEVVEIADIEGLAPSSDGRELAFRVQRASVSSNSYSIHWYVADLSTGKVIRVADGGDPIYNDGLIEAEAPIWSPDGRYFYHRALVDGAIGIWRVAADGSGSTAVVVGDSDVESFALGADGRTLDYVTGPSRDEIERAERREYDDGILVDASVDPTVNIFRGGYVHGRLSTQRLIGRWYEHGGLLWQAARVRHRIDIESSRELATEVLPKRKLESLTASWKPPGLRVTGPDGAIAVTSGSEDEPRLEIDRRGTRPVRCASAPCRAKIVSLVWRPGMSDVLFTTQDEHSRQSLYLWKTDTARVELVSRSDGELSGGRSGSVPCAVTRASAICVAASAVSPPRLELFALDGRRHDVLFDPNETLRARPEPGVEQLTFKLDDGRSATGTLLFRPGAAPPHRVPLFVNYYYCSGYLRGGVGDSYPFAPLVDSGFMVACLNVVPFKQWGDGADRERAALASVTSLVRLLGDRGWIDPSRVAMGGFSAGSEATMWVAMNSGLLAAAAVASPQYEPTDYWMSSVRGRDVPRILRDFQQVGSPDQDPERWKVISPALNVDRIRAPLLMQLPEQEMRAAIELYSKLSNTSTPVEMYAFPDEAHIKIQPRHQLAVYARSLDWFRYWVQGQKDPDGAKAEQYRRWDELRRRRSAGE